MYNSFFIASIFSVFFSVYGVCCSSDDSYESEDAVDQCEEQNAEEERNMSELLRGFPDPYTFLPMRELPKNARTPAGFIEYWKTTTGYTIKCFMAFDGMRFPDYLKDR